MRRKIPTEVKAVLVVALMLVVGGALWILVHFVLYGYHEDDGVVELLKSEGATVARWPADDLLSKVAGADNGKVQSVGFSRMDIQDKHLDAIVPLTKCTHL